MWKAPRQYHARGPRPADRVNEGDAIFGQEFADRIEKCIVVADAHMLEHTDRHNPVKFAFELAIIFK